MHCRNNPFLGLSWGGFTEKPSEMTAFGWLMGIFAPYLKSITNNRNDNNSDIICMTV